MGCVGDYVVFGVYDEVVRRVLDVDLVVWVGGVVEDAFVFFVEVVYRVLCECDHVFEYRRVGGKRDVLLGAVRCVVRAVGDREPGCFVEVGVVVVMFDRLQYVVGEVGEWEVGDGVAFWFEEQHCAVVLDHCATV